MPWPTPQYSRNEVNRAGNILRGPNRSFEDNMWALFVLDNWRACHGHTINTFQATLRKYAAKVDPDALISQRLKRRESIYRKLQLQPQMNLARMHDIGGVRAVVKGTHEVRELQQLYTNNDNLKHIPKEPYDYIQNPKRSGYRSIHLVYKYRNTRAPKYKDMLVEIQIRNTLQHAWATAVEIMETFLQQALKSSQGDQEWLDFFALAGSAFALLEDCPPVPQYNHLSDVETFRRTRDEAERLDIKRQLEGFALATEVITSHDKGKSYYLITLDPGDMGVLTQSWGRRKHDEAIEAYNRIERQIAGGRKVHAVLVSADSVEALKNAYPSYFLNSGEFLLQLNQISDMVFDVTL